MKSSDKVELEGLIWALKEKMNLIRKKRKRSYALATFHILESPQICGTIYKSLIYVAVRRAVLVLSLVVRNSRANLSRLRSHYLVRWKALTESVCYFIAKDLQPYDTVNDVGFLRMICILLAKSV